MPIVDQIVNVAITAQSATPSLPGTDIPAILGDHTVWSDRIRTYFHPRGMLTDRFPATPQLVLMANAIGAQNPRPSSFKVIRGTSAQQQVLHFKVTDTTVGDVVGLILTDAAGVTHAVQHTVLTGEPV